LHDLDIARSDALCDYLLEIHRVPGADSGLYVRRIRELVGHGECIMGLTDSYPPHPLIPASLMEEIEHLCVKWRWKLKSRVHRLRQVHGDFHPWNILFENGRNFHILDRSRGEWGDPADDVSCITANYLFFSLQRHGCIEGAMGNLFERFGNGIWLAPKTSRCWRWLRPFSRFEDWSWRARFGTPHCLMKSA
jgi:aminoglycoside phosphotransferase (APT) family kinase protein